MMDAASSTEEKGCVYTVEELLSLRDHEIEVELSLSDPEQSVGSCDGENRDQETYMDGSRFPGLYSDQTLGSRLKGSLYRNERESHNSQSETLDDKAKSHDLGSSFRFQMRRRYDDGNNGDKTYCNTNYNSTGRFRSDAITSWRSQDRGFNSLSQTAPSAREDLSPYRQTNDLNLLTTQKGLIPWLEDDNIGEPICLSTLRLPEELEVQRRALYSRQEDGRDVANVQKASESKDAGESFFDGYGVRKLQIADADPSVEEPSVRYREGPLTPFAEKSFEKHMFIEPSCQESSQWDYSQKVQQPSELGMSVPISSIFRRIPKTGADESSSKRQINNQTAHYQTIIPETELIARIKKSSSPVSSQNDQQQQPYTLNQQMLYSKRVNPDFLPAPHPDKHFIYNDSFMSLPRQPINPYYIFHGDPRVRPNFTPPQSYCHPFYVNPCASFSGTFGVNSPYIVPSQCIPAPPAANQDHLDENAPVYSNNQPQNRNISYYESLDSQDGFNLRNPY